MRTARIWLQFLRWLHQLDTCDQDKTAAEGLQARAPLSTRQGGLICSGALGGPPQFHYTTSTLCKYCARA